MADSTWTFEQISGNPKTLTLNGWAAPFGRPRQKAVVEEETVVNENTIRYPGSYGLPTRHIFNQSSGDFNLDGRFMDRDLGKGGAREKVTEVKSFVNDKLQVRITWAGVISVLGFIKSVRIGWESEGQATWKLQIKVDSDLTLNNPFTVIESFSPTAAAAEIDKLRSEMVEPIQAPQKPTGLQPNLLDSLENLADLATVYTGQLASWVDDAGSFASATVGQLNRVRYGIKQAKTAVIKLNNAIGRTVFDMFVIASDSAAEIESADWRIGSDMAATRIIAMLVEMDRQAEIATTGDAATSYVAKGGDTWELISTARYGGPERADDLRLANGIQYGEAPEPGRRYTVPLA